MTTIIGLALPCGDERVQNLVGVADGGPARRRVGPAMQQIEHRDTYLPRGS